MKTKIKHKITVKGIEFFCLGAIEHDPGVHTYPNGDPGYPPSTEVEFDQIYQICQERGMDEEATEVTELIDAWDLWKDFEDAALEQVEYN